jgi:hypothetical protein
LKLDKHLGLPDNPLGPPEAMQEPVNGNHVLFGKRASALLAITQGRIGNPDGVGNPRLKNKPRE